MKGMRTVGYLVTHEKAEKHLTPALRQRLQQGGIQVEHLNVDTALDEQAHLAAVVHKGVGNADMERRIAEFQAAHTSVPIIDPVARVRPLHDRATMLGALGGGGITILAPHDETERRSVLVRSPPQVVLPEGVSCAQALDTLDAAGLQLPLVAKPRFAGQPGSHGLALVRDLAGLQALVLGGPDAPLRPPLLLQQFVEHGSTLTKVYVAGAGVVAVQRSSLDSSQIAGDGLVAVSRVSKFPASALPPYPLPLPPMLQRPQSEQQQDSLPQQQQQQQQQQEQVGARDCAGVNGAAWGEVEVVANQAVSAAEHMTTAPFASSLAKNSSRGGEEPDAAREGGVEGAEGNHEEAGGDAAVRKGAAEVVGPVPGWMVRGLAATLRHNTGLQLFNFDLLCPTTTVSFDESTPDYYVIDINFFPGFEKLPHYEELLTKFLLGVVDGEMTEGGFGEASFAACNQLMGSQ